jgi:hypothetical protein
VRFIVMTDCPPERCKLLLNQATNPAAAVPMAMLVHGYSLIGTMQLSIASAGKELVSPMILSHASLRHRLARAIARFYRIALRTLWPLACIGLLLALVFRRRCAAPPLLYALALGSAVAVICRVLLLSYLEVTSIPSNNILYLSPATSFLIIFVVLGLYLGIDAAVRLQSKAPN